MSDIMASRTETLVSDISHELCEIEFAVWQFTRELDSADTRDILALDKASAPAEPNKTDFAAPVAPYQYNPYQMYYGKTEPDMGYYSDEAQVTDIPHNDDDCIAGHDIPGQPCIPSDNVVIRDENGWIGRTYDDPTETGGPFYTDVNGQTYTEREYYLWYDEITKSDIPDDVDPGQSWWDNLRERSDPDA
jgi:hypothetical protein